jgi:uncharacterized protein YdhG (YjbR/CyaY superfamily)
MPEKTSVKKGRPKSAKSTPSAGKKTKGLSEVERAAMKARLQELKAEERANRDREFGEKTVLAKIATMPEPDRTMAKRIHAIVKATAPSLMPRTWYGMPAYTKDGKVVCFFQSGHQYKTRYCTFGFQEAAKLDEGGMWATGFALKELTATEEARIGGLVKRAVS